LTSKQFFLERIDPAASRTWLEGAEHHHLARVARIKAGERIWIFDREGMRYPADVEVVEKDRTCVRLVGPAEVSGASVGITLGQALIKPANMDLIVRKAAELGVTALVPLITARSLSGLAGAGGTKIERWRKIALEGAKQSLRSTATSIEPIMPVEDFAVGGIGARRLYLSESGGTLLGEILTGPREPSAVPTEVVLITGPEGGWTDDEGTMLENAGFEAVSLGRIVLRAETAAIVAVGMISHFWGG
jgi:16S rRNA (uracil1498-N3)-methyltransferase